MQVEHLNVHLSHVSLTLPLTAGTFEQVAGMVPLQAIKCHLQPKVLY